MARMRGEIPVYAPCRSWRELPLNTRLKTRYTYTHRRTPNANTHTHTRYTCTCKFIFASRLAVCVSVCVFTAFVCVCDLARLCACVFLHVRAYVSLCLCVGLLRCGFLAVEWPCDVRVGAGSQHPVLQEEVLGVSQVCGAALPPRC